MRAAILGLVVFALGLATAALVVSPRAGAHIAGGTLSGKVGPNFTISMSASSVTAGNYTINVDDEGTIHNFHFFGPGVNQKTSIGGTGSVSWSVTLQPGTYTFQCDLHADSMNGTLTVTAGTTTTAPTTTAQTTTAQTTTAQTTTAQTTTAQTTTARTTTEHTTTEQTTSEAETTTAATTTTAPATTTSEPETTESTPTTTPAKPLVARVAKTHATARTVRVTVTSNRRGRAVAELFSGTHRVARATGRVPGTLVLHAAHALKHGSYRLRLRVTAGGKTVTSTRVVTVR